MFSLFSNSNDDDEKKSAEDMAKRIFFQKVDEIPEQYFDTINEKILNEEFYNISHFLGGEFLIEYVDAKGYICAYKLYFQDKNNNAYEVESKSKSLDLTRLSADAQKDLAEKKQIKYDISEPDEKFRKNYKLVKQD